MEKEMNVQEVQEKVEEGNIKKDVSLEAGRVYNLYDFKPDNVSIIVVPREKVDIVDFAKEIITASKYAEKEEDFNKNFPKICPLCNR